MKIIKKIGIMMGICVSSVLTAQEDTAYYLPYQMPTHTTVKFNTFLANPTFPMITNIQEKNIGIYYRSQWSGLQDKNNSLMGASFGFNWKERNGANFFIYQRSVGVMSNIGLVANYGHFVELSDTAGLRLGLNVVPMYSGINTGRVIIADPSDPLLAVKKSFALTVQPGFDFNVGGLHFGLTAENLLDYSIGAKKAMTNFDAKTFTGHLMYRGELEDDPEIFERGSWNIMARATQSPEGLVLTGTAGIDLPKLGWLYAGYNQSYGTFAGLGFNIGEAWSLGMEYENSNLGGKIPTLGSTIGFYANYQFGGDRQANARSEKMKKDQRAAAARQRQKDRMAARAAALAAKPIEQPKEPEVVKVDPPAPPTPTTKPVTPKGDDGLTETKLNTGVTVNIKQENIASDKIQKGYYVIIGVYQDGRNAFKLIQTMRKKYTVGAFINPLTNRTYVYLEQPAMSADDAQNIYRKNLYNQDFMNTGMWVLEVTGK